jgi:predicted GH43/DUF377 family glycosyl hydrolase
VNAWCAFAALAFTACRPYADFTLPSVAGSLPVAWRWSARVSPVLERGGWDAHDVLNPSVLFHAGGWLNLYSGFDGRAWHTGLATSSDGIVWSKGGRVLSPDTSGWEGGYIAANGTALAWHDEVLYWYQAGPKGSTRIALARSRDGRNWRKEPGPVLDYGPRGSWDERGLGDPYVIRASGYFYLYYLGQDRARRQRLGVARSRDGVRWEKLRANPVLEAGGYASFDENGVGEPAVWQSHTWYWMLYTGRDRAERRRMGLARSRDGVAWERTSLVIAGSEPWNEAVVCDATVAPEGDTVRVWFGGGRRPSPDENLDGTIGYATLHATLAR